MQIINVYKFHRNRNIKLTLQLIIQTLIYQFDVSWLMYAGIFESIVKHNHSCAYFNNIVSHVFVYVTYNLNSILNINKLITSIQNFTLYLYDFLSI